MTETAATPEAKTRTKKGEGPVVINFLDAAKAAFPRISDKTVALEIKDKAGDTLSFDLSTLPEGVIKQLAYAALKQRVDSAIRAEVDNDGKNDKGELVVISTAQAVIDRIMSGQIYARTGVAGKGDGVKGPRGRPFDFDIWVSAMKDAAQIKSDAGKKRDNGQPYTPATEDQLSRLRVKLEAATPAERKKMTDGFLKDKTVAFAHAKIKAARLAEAAKADLESEDSDKQEVSADLE